VSVASGECESSRQSFALAAVGASASAVIIFILLGVDGIILLCVHAACQLSGETAIFLSLFIKPSHSQPGRPPAAPRADL